MDVIYLDFAKAFDKVPHQRLYGVLGDLLSWIRGWLLNRWQRVGVRGRWSRWRRVMTGIPQGSVLGPVLFMVFIDNLEEGLRSDVLKFADDTKIFRRVDSEVDREVLQRDLDRLVQWSEVWQMRFNVDKCKVMHLMRGNFGGNYVMNGGSLGVVDEERDLGVRITNDLMASAHYAYVSSRANRVLGMISRTMVYRSPNILTRLYKSRDAPSGVLCVDLVTALCEGQGKAGKSAAQVYENGTGVEGLGVWGETGEVEIDDFGGEKKSFGSGRVRRVGRIFYREGPTKFDYFY